MKEHQHAAEAEIPPRNCPRNYPRNYPRNATTQGNITTVTGEVTVEVTGEVTRLLLACREAISWLIGNTISPPKAELFRHLCRQGN